MLSETFLHLLIITVGSPLSLLAALCSTQISVDDLQKVDMVLMHFCRRFGQLYGKEAITPNMHLHAHLRECIQDYGPIYSFWLFSFERYNGMLGNFPNNQRSIEIQLMR